MREILLYGSEKSPSSKTSHYTFAYRRSFLILLCALRGVYYIVENPQSSVYQHHPSVARTYALLGTRRIHSWLGHFGNPMPKPVYFWNNLPGNISRKIHGKKPQKTKEGKHWQKQGKGWTGGKALESTKEYPPKLAKAMIGALLDARAL